MNKILVFFPNYGSGIGSCLITFSILLEVAKFLKFDFAVDWSKRAQLKDKNCCIFEKFFEYPNNLEGTKIYYGNNIYDRFTKKGKLIKPNDLFNNNLNRQIYVARNSCSENLIKNYIPNYNEVIKKNLKNLNFIFKQNRLNILRQIVKENFCSVHLRTGNNEFSTTSPYWKRDSFIKRKLPFILISRVNLYVKKLNKKIIFKNKYIFTDSKKLLSYFVNKNFYTIQNKFINENIHYKNYFDNLEEGLDFFEQSLFEILIMSKATLLIWDGSGFAKAAILLSNKKSNVQINKLLGYYKFLDDFHKLFVLFKRTFTKRSLLNITK